MCSSDLAKKQMMFQESMSNTAHQRQVADLRAAGLNPILSARLGGASTPSGAQQQVIPNIGGAAANSALNAYNTVAQVQEREKHAELMGSQKTASDEQAGLYRAQAAESAQRARLTGAQADIEGARLEGELNWEKLQQQFGQWLNAAKAFGPTVERFIGRIIRNISGSRNKAGGTRPKKEPLRIRITGKPNEGR